MPAIDNSRGGQTRARRAKRRSKPAPRPAARAQENYYRSQGRAVERQANRQRRRARRPSTPAARRPPAFRPLPSSPAANRPLEQVRREGRRKVTRARTKLSDHPAVPNVPVKRNYTAAERRAILLQMRRGVDRAGVDSITDLYSVASPRQRRRLRAVGKSLARRNARVNPQGPPAQIPTRKGPGDNQIKAAGLTFDLRVPGKQSGLRDVARVVSPLPIPGTVAGELTRATVESPGQVLGSSARAAKESILGIPQAAKMIVEDVKHGRTDSIKAILQDYEDRYGTIFTDPAEFRKRVKEDYGLTSYALDALTVAAGTGQAAGAATRLPAVQRAATRLQRKDGKVAKRAGQLLTATTRERPAVRFAPGEAGVKRQVTARNLWKAVAQHGHDRARARQYDRMVAGADLQPGPGGRLVSRRGPEGYHQGKRLPGLRPGDREVVARHGARYGSVRSGRGITLPSVRELPTLRRYTGRAARDLGGEQSKTRLMLLTHRGRTKEQIRKQLDRLDENEKRALKYMHQLGLRPGPSAERALRRRLAQMTRARKGRAVKPILEKTNDEVRLIREILRDPDRFLTGKLRDVDNELLAVQRAEEGRDPHLDPDQAEIRRVTPQGAMLNVHRGPDVAYFREVLGRLEVDTETPGLAAYADELARLHPADRPARVAEMAREVAKATGASERDVNTALRRVVAERNRHQAQELRGRPYETEDVREARAELAMAKRDRRSAQRALPRAVGRAAAVTGRLTERQRAGAPLDTPAVREARRRVSAEQRQLNRLERRIGGTERRAGRRIGEALGRETRGRNMRALEAEGSSIQLQAQVAFQRDVLRQRQLELRDVEAAAPRVTGRQHDRFEEADEAQQLALERLTETEAIVKAAREHLTEQLERAPRVSEASYRRLENREAELAAAREVRDQLRKFEQAFGAVVRAARSKQTMRLEDARSFSEKVRRAAEEEGLTEPGYWWSSVRPEEMPSLAAAGRGLKAAHGNKRYTGRLYDVGAEEFGADVFTRGVERNIKRRFQTNLVARNIETYAFEWSRGPTGAGLTAKEIKAQLDTRFIDPVSVDFIDANLINRRPTERSGTERGEVLSGEQLDDLMERGEDFISTTQQDLAAARRRWRDIEPDEIRGLSANRYVVVTRDVTETLDGVANRMDSPGWRAWEILSKQKPARLLLGAANIPWLGFQMASNTFLTGIGGGWNPFNVHGALKLDRHLKRLDPDVHAAWEAELGITHGHHFMLDETHLGATNRRMVNFWRGYKETKVGRLGTRVNPLNLMFRADEKQNNFFRKVLFYDRARKEAYRRMGHNWKQSATSIDKLMTRVLAKPPDKQLELIAHHGDEFERVARHVADFLGDYTRFTPSERFLLSRNVMFYGYLRFSLRFAFHTMPIAHPIMTNVLSTMGRLGAQEIKELFGVPANYDLPATMLAQAYFGDRKDAERGTLKSLPFGRMNPFGNALTQLDGLQQAVGVVSPLYQAAADQAFEESSFTGRDWRIEGRSTPGPSEIPRNYYGSATNLLDPSAYSWPRIGPIPGNEGKPRNRILQDQLLSLAFPYRAAASATMDPNQSDDALLWAPQPMQYADEEAAAGVAKSRRDFRAIPLAQRIGGQVFPVFPRPTAAPQVVERERERAAAAAERRSRAPGTRKPRKTKARTNRYGGSTGSRSSSYGGSGGSGYASRYGG